MKVNLIKIIYRYILSSLFSFIVVLDGGTLWHSQRFLQCTNYIIFKFTPCTTPLYPSFPWSMEQFQQVSLLQLHACVHIFCTVFTLLPPFPATNSLPLVPTFIYLFIYLFIYFWQYWGLNSGPHIYYAGAFLLEPLYQPSSDF
jgi:hypothetical protein